jgi:hypothetical protein
MVAILDGLAEFERRQRRMAGVPHPASRFNSRATCVAYQ